MINSTFSSIISKVWITHLSLPKYSMEIPPKISAILFPKINDKPFAAAKTEEEKEGIINERKYLSRKRRRKRKKKQRRNRRSRGRKSHLRFTYCPNSKLTTTFVTKEKLDVLPPNFGFEKTKPFNTTAFMSDGKMISVVDFFIFRVGVGWWLLSLSNNHLCIYHVDRHTQYVSIHQYKIKLK